MDEAGALADPQQSHQQGGNADNQEDSLHTRASNGRRRKLVESGRSASTGRKLGFKFRDQLSHFLFLGRLINRQIAPRLMQ